jgi:hypothetical protein
VRSLAGGCLCCTILAVALVGCDVPTDPATRLAADLEAGASRLDSLAAVEVLHRPADAGECTGPYQVQLDAVGALIVWCKDAAGATVSSHSTSSHARYVDAPETHIVEKDAGATLVIGLERRAGRAVVVVVR